MSVSIPVSTRTILEAMEANPEPLVDYEISSKLAGLHHAEGLTESERKGAWAESSAFSFRPMDESPWGTHYGPVFSATKPDGTPIYTPDIDEIDEEIINHWEERSEVAQHPVLGARYADLVWDLKKHVAGKQPDVRYAQRAIDAYLEAINGQFYKEPIIHAVEASRRALQLAVSINDKERTRRCRQRMIELFESAQANQTGAWTRLCDCLIENKKAGLTAEESAQLIEGLENRLAHCSTFGGEQFDAWGAEAAARRLASFYERGGKRQDVQRVIRVYGSAFEQLAAQASPMLAMSWLQPVHDEYKNRGMNEDAARVQAASAEKGKNIASDLKQISVPIKFTEDQIRQLVEELTRGSPRDALLRITREFIPKIETIKAQLEELLTTAPLMARVSRTRIVGDHFAAKAGSIEEDPEGRLIMQLADQIGIYNFFLNRSLTRLRETNAITADMILALLEESPLFTSERRPLLEKGIQEYLDGEHINAIHVMLPQIEQALRQLLTLSGVPILKAARNGTMQLKNLNDILREPAMKAALGEDLRLYLLTFLADERGQNIRNTVCHGIAAPAQLNQQLADQTLHALLTISLVRQQTTDGNS